MGKASSFIVLIIIVMFIMLLLQRRRIRRLGKRLDALEKTVAALSPPVEKRITEAAAPPPVQPAVHAPVPPAAEAPPKRHVPPEKPSPVRPKKRSERWVRIEKQFIENWTGIVGALAIVMGAGFLGVYAALSMAPFFRFLMLTGLAAVLFAAFVVLKRRTEWRNIAGWLRSGAGAVFLFSCLGAGSISGLRWIDDPRPASLLLIAGIIVNLAMGFAGRHQVFASFHAVLSLVALAIAPQTNLTFAAAAVVVFIGVLMTYRARWEYHLIVIISSFLAYHLYWYYSLGIPAASMSLPQRLFGIGITAAIGAAACLVHYRELYRSRGMDTLPFIAHLLNWCSIGAGLLLYSTGSRWNTVLLAGVSVIAFVLARRAGKLGIPWLHGTDSLISQAIALFAVYTLHRWGVGAMAIAVVMYVEVLVFLLVALKEKNGFLVAAGFFLHYLSGIAVIIVSLVLFDEPGGASALENAALLSAAAVLGTLMHCYAVSRKETVTPLIALSGPRAEKTVAFGGIVTALLLITVHLHIYSLAWSGYAVAAAGTAYYIIRQRLQSGGLSAGLLLFTAAAFCLAWFHTASSLAGDTAGVALYGAPFFVLAAAGVRFPVFVKNGRGVAWPCIYLFAVHGAVFTHFLTVHLSPFIPGVLYLLYAALFLEAAVRRAGSGTGADVHRYLYHMACMFLALFLARHFLVHLQSGLYLGPLRLRLIIELYALAALLHWAAAKLPDIAASDVLWRLNPLAWETLLVFAVITAALEIPAVWHPLAWVAFSLALYVTGVRFGEKLSRFRFYSVLLFWASAVHVAFRSSIDATPSPDWTDQAWTGAVFALVFQFAPVIAYHRRGGIGEVRFPAPLTVFGKLAGRIHRRQNLWIYYPFFAAVALFLFWTFDRSVLTLLWVAESFAIFILSIFLRESHFRYLSMAALSGCLVRMVFYDLSRSGTLTRALVFLGVGTIMVAMNVLYNKFRDRF